MLPPKSCPAPATSSWIHEPSLLQYRRDQLHISLHPDHTSHSSIPRIIEAPKVTDPAIAMLELSSRSPRKSAEQGAHDCDNEEGLPTLCMIGQLAIVGRPLPSNATLGVLDGGLLIQRCTKATSTYQVGIKAWLGTHISHVARVPSSYRPSVFACPICAQPGLLSPLLLPLGTTLHKSSHPVPKSYSDLSGNNPPAQQRKSFCHSPIGALLYTTGSVLRQELARPMASTREPTQAGHKICLPSGVFLD
ncbi:hypothetical protein BDP81DRAFT_220848 [Colletotrichum phormii]|uniref:Uncharacterized protein n=1 Tax=Colletotrichum phormii TaxID=359342 RepID=A0AAI9ZV76_9PEZI|nr:uncharacterized protein BDP81DRAFT_220848 [Colletotrichum phormii]KAK1637232.1 hypothetical protein BDP81DRAFT_220848 [Colletotrichum phormii]